MFRFARDWDWPQSAIRLLPTDEQRAELDETWERMTRLMTWVDEVMQERGGKTFVKHHQSFVAHMRNLPDAKGMSAAMLEGIVRTVSRHHTGSDAGAERDWSKAEEVVIVGRVARMLADFDYLSIQTHGPRIRVAYDVLIGGASVFRQRRLIFYWGRLDGEYVLLYLPGEYARSIKRRTVWRKREWGRSRPTEQAQVGNLSG